MEPAGRVRSFDTWDIPDFPGSAGPPQEASPSHHHFYGWYIRHPQMVGSWHWISMAFRRLAHVDRVHRSPFYVISGVCGTVDDPLILFWWTKNFQKWQYQLNSLHGFFHGGMTFYLDQHWCSCIVFGIFPRTSASWCFGLFCMVKTWCLFNGHKIGLF